MYYSQSDALITLKKRLFECCHFFFCFFLTFSQSVTIYYLETFYRGCGYS